MKCIHEFNFSRWSEWSRNHEPEQCDSIEALLSHLQMRKLLARRNQSSFHNPVAPANLRLRDRGGSELLVHMVQFLLESPVGKIELFYGFLANYLFSVHFCFNWLLNISKRLPISFSANSRFVFQMHLAFLDYLTLAPFSIAD